MSNLNVGLQKIVLSDFKPIVCAEKKRLADWQYMALKIKTNFKLDGKRSGVIFKICKKFPLAYVEHCYNETKELARNSDLMDHYFVKLIYKK